MRTDRRNAQVGERFSVEIRAAKKGERFISQGIIWVAEGDRRPVYRDVVIIEETMT